MDFNDFSHLTFSLSLYWTKRETGTKNSTEKFNDTWLFHQLNRLNVWHIRQIELVICNLSTFERFIAADYETKEGSVALRVDFIAISFPIIKMFFLSFKLQISCCVPFFSLPFLFSLFFRIREQKVSRENDLCKSYQMIFRTHSIQTIHMLAGKV